MTPVQFTVLIADDEATIRNGLREIIPWETYQAQVIDAAADGTSALASIRRNRPDLVIIDVKMPGIDGLEVIRFAREEGIASRFIILSGYNDFELAQKAIRYGANAYFLKPLKVNEFKDELSRQFAEILSHRAPDAAPANIGALLQTSRLFLLNQLVQNELRSPEELARRCSMLRLSLDSQGPCFASVVSVLTDDRDRADSALHQLEALLLDRLAPMPAEVWTLSDRYVVLLVQGAQPSPGFQHMLAGLLEPVRARTDLRIAAGVGQEVTALIHAAQSFSTALRALSYDLYRLPGDVYGPEVICMQVPSSGQPDGTYYERLTEAMETGSGIDQLCGSYLSALFFVPMPPPDYVRGKCTLLVSSLCERFNVTHPEEGPFSPPAMDAARRIHSIPDLTEWLVGTLTGYSEQYRSARRMADPLVEAAKAYIRSHLSENVKASDVAAQVNLSTSYFTIYFKAKAGCNFRDYVLTEKMKYAKELLQQGMNVSEIAYAIGYTDYRSFSRAFKNVTGHTPSDYLNV